MASQTSAVQKEMPTTVNLSAYLKEAKSGIVVAIGIQFLLLSLLFSLSITVEI